jgi:hypothetical protein
MYENDMLVKRINRGMYGGAIELNLRPRITLSNPINSLDVAGWWK